VAERELPAPETDKVEKADEIDPWRERLWRGRRPSGGPAGAYLRKLLPCVEESHQKPEKWNPHRKGESDHIRHSTTRTWANLPDWSPTLTD